MTLDELVQLGQSAPGLRGPELLDWGRYVQGGGAIFPLTLLTREGEMIPPPPTSSSTTTPSLASAPTAIVPLPSSADTASSFSSSSSLVHARVAAEHEAGGSGIGTDGSDAAQPLEDLTTSVTGITPRREATLVLTEERGSS